MKNKPIKLDKNGKVEISKYRMKQLKNHSSEDQARVLTAIQCLVDIQGEAFDLATRKDLMRKAKEFLLKPVPTKTDQSRVYFWIDDLIEKVRLYTLNKNLFIQ